MGESRTKRASRNVLVGIISKILLMTLAFATKTLFVRLLGVEYNGVSGLYSNILSVLALSELGVGNVLNYSLYSALKENNVERIQALVSYFKKIYYIIAFSISIIGIILIPFLRYIINSELPHDKLIIYYILYLINSIASYFVVYKTTVIIADQNNYVRSLCETISTIIMYIAQILYLFVVKDFLGYLVIQVLCTILKNLMLNFITNNKYPYLRKIDKKNNNLNPQDKKNIFDNIKATFLYKVSAVALNNTDNILISILVGTVYVGYYSNYYMIVSNLTVFVGILITGISASLGNLNAENNIEASYRMFNILCFIFSLIGSVEVCCLVNCFQQFIPIWIGSEHVMDFTWVIFIVLNLYLITLMNPIWMFRESMGLFKQVRFIMIITAALNILLSIILGLFFGVPGILGATFISRFAFQYWYEPTILFRRFSKPVRHFYVGQIKQFLAMIIATLLSMWACNSIGDNIICLFLRAIISAIIATSVIIIINFKNESMRYLITNYIKPVFIKSK